MEIEIVRGRNKILEISRKAQLKEVRQQVVTKRNEKEVNLLKRTK